MEHLPVFRIRSGSDRIRIPVEKKTAPEILLKKFCSLPPYKVDLQKIWSVQFNFAFELLWIRMFRPDPDPKHDY